MLFSTLATDIVGEFPNCPIFTIERTIREAASEFFERSMAWTVTQDAETLPKGVETFDLDLPTSTRLVSVASVKYGSKELSGMHRDDMDRLPTDWTVTKGNPLSYIYNDESSIRLYPIPDESRPDQMRVRFSVAPTRDATDIPDILGERYYEHILYGARYRLAKMPGMPWTNPALAAMNQQMFEQKVRNAKVDAFMEYGRPNRQIRMVRI